jgi:hypothetical protein
MMLRINSISEKGWLLIVLSVALILRLFLLTGFSLSNDELSALARLQFNSLKEVIDRGVYVDFHPAGVQILLYLWTGVFGISEWIGYLWFGFSTGILAAAAVAVLEFPLMYSQIARPYSPGLLFSMMATYFWTRLLFRSNEDHSSGKSILIAVSGFVLSVSACMYVHYFSFIFAGILCFTGMFFLKRKMLPWYLASGVLIVLLYTPHLDIFFHQLSKGGVGGAEGWLGPPKPDAFEKYINYIFNDSNRLKWIYLVILAGTILLYRGKFRLTKFHFFSLCFFVVPVATAYYYSLHVNPVFQYSVLLFSFPFLLLLIFSFIPADTRGFTTTFLLLIVLASGSYSTVVEKHYYRTPHFTEFRALAQRVKQADNQLGRENITRVANVFDPYYIQYYLEKLNHDASFELYTVLSADEKRKFYQLIENSETPFFVYTWSNTWFAPEYDVAIRNAYPYMLVNDTMLRSGFRLYSRTQNDSSLNTRPLISLNYGFESALLENEMKLRDSTRYREGNFSVFIEGDQEFSPAWVLDAAQVFPEPGLIVEVSAAFYSAMSIQHARLVFSIETADGSVLWKASGLSDFFSEREKWFRVFIATDSPHQIPANAKIKIYCWNEKQEEFFMDDVRLRVYSAE